MSKINGAGASFSLSDEEPASTETDDPDENLDALNESFLSSRSGNSAQNGNSRWENHVYIQHDEQVGAEHPYRVCAKRLVTDTGMPKRVVRLPPQD